MRFAETPLHGAFLIDLEYHTDDRGGFARTFCQDEFAAHGLTNRVIQCNLSYNHRAGTLRGMHYQLPPAAEAKLVRCVRGEIHDVIIDLRPESSTYLEHFGVDLTAENRTALFVPEMFAHGYQALSDGAEVLYQVSESYTPGAERGLPHDDPHFAIKWPTAVTAISDKDSSWPAFDPATISS